MRGRLSILFALVLALLMAPAAKGQQLFSDFPVNGQISAFQVNGGYSASNSFTFASAGTIGEVVFGAWVSSGDSVTGVTWSIGTTPFDTSLGKGVAGATSSYDSTNVDGFDVNTVTFAIPNITLPAGTYYLTISNAVSASGNPVYWDINNAAGVDAWNSGYGHVSAANACYATIGISGTCASSFQLEGTSPALTALPSYVGFADQTVNTTSTAQPVTITNTGSGAATIAGIAISGTNPGDFAQTNNCPLSPATLAVSGTCTINVTFTPQAANALAAAVTLTGSSPLAIPLSGTGTPVPASQVAFSTEPPATGMPETELGAVAVKIEDANGNLVTTSSAQVTLSSTPSGVSGTLTANAVNGVATFNDLVFTASGTYTLTASSSGLTGATSTSITIGGLSPTSQYLFGSQGGSAVPAAAQSWTGLIPVQAGLWQNNATTGDTYALMPTTGTFSSLCVNLTAAPGAGASWIWTLYKNGSDQPITVTISGAQKQACDLVDTTGFIPGDLVALHVTPSSGPAPASTFASWYIVQTPQVPGETILFGSQQAGNAQYLSLAGNSSSLATEPAMETILPAAGTVTKYVAEYVGTGSSVKAVLDHDQSASSLSVSLTSGVFVEQTGNVSVSAGDVFDVNETGITGTSAVYASIVFMPNVAGQFVIPTFRNSVSNADPLYYLAVSGRTSSPLQTTEAGAQQIGGNVQIQGVYAQSLAAPGGGAQYAFTLRDNKANTALSTTLSGTSLTACTTSAPATGCATGTAVAVNNLDLLDTSVVPAGSPAATTVNISYLAYVPQLAFTTQPPATGAVGTVLSPVVVQLQDENGNAITGSTAQVTISSTPAGVSGTLTANAVNGVATFSNLVFNASGTYSLIASVSGLTPTTSSPISIGTGTAPPASLSPALSFPNTLTGTTSSALAATLSNTGSAPLNNIVPSITGANPSDFALTTGANACGATLAAGSSCSIYVTFTPASATSFSATLSVADSASGSPQTVALSGTGTAPAASLSPALSFPSTLAGTTSSALAATLSNTGTAPLNNIVPSITGANPSDFALTTGANACGATLAAGSSCSIYVTFTPASATSFSATLSVADSASGSPQTVALSGTGTGATSSTSQYLFGSQGGSAVPTAAQSWTGLMPIQAGLWQNNATTGDTYALMPTTGTFSSLCVNLTTAPGAGASWIWTLYKNGSDQPITVTISGAQKQACDSVDTTGFVLGDLVALHVTPSSGPAPASTFASWYIVQTPQVPGETILFGSQQAGNAEYLALAGNSASLSTEPAMETILPAAGTVTKYVAEYVGTGSSVKAVLDHNQSASSLLVSLTSGVFVEQTGNVSVSAGDVFDVNETGITGTSAVYASIVFMPNVAGQFVIPTFRNSVSNADPLYYLAVSGRTSSPLQTTEAGAQQIGGNVQIQGVYAQSLAAPGSGAQYAFTLRDNNANTALSTTLGGTNLTACTTSAPTTGCATGTAVAVNNLDLLGMSVVPAGSPAATTVNISYLAYVP